jgi:uncharacterized protein
METPEAYPTLTLCDDLRVALADYARTGLRFGVWASSGRGKSFGVGVLCEELLAAGIPVIALDPEGEIFTLRERFRVLVLGGAHADLPLPTGDAAVTLALGAALDEGLGLVIDLSDRPTSRAQQEAAYPFLERLFRLLSERRTPAALVVEEVHVFAPQSGSALTSDILHRFAKQGRKRGVILATASQRTQAVSKELMSQLNFQAIGGFEIERDYDAVKAIVDGHSFEEFRALPVGEFFFSAVNRFGRFRQRHTTHGGDAPSFRDEAVAERRPDAELGPLLDALRAALAREADSTPAADPTRPLRAEIRRLEQRLEQAEEARQRAEAEAERLRIALHVAGVVKVVVQNEVVVRAAAPTAAPMATPSAIGAPALPPAPPAPMAIVEVETTSAKSAAPTLRDLAIPVDQLLDVPGVKAMILDARRRARRRAPHSVALVTLAAKLLASGVTPSAEDVAARSGSRGMIAQRRAAHALDALVAAGFARAPGEDGRHVLHEAALLRAVAAR